MENRIEKLDKNIILHVIFYNVFNFQYAPIAKTQCETYQHCDAGSSFFETGSNLVQLFLF